MQKILIIFFLISVFIGCSKDSGSSNNKVKVSKPVNTNPEEQPSTLPITGPEIPSENPNLLKTKLIKNSMYACLLDPSNPPLQTFLDKTLINGKAEKNFEIVLNEKFVQKAIADLLNKANGQKISPDFFWTNLDSQLANNLNDYLAHRYLNMSAEKFNFLRKLIAYGITYFMEKQDYKVGYFIQYADKQTLKIAFSPEADTAEYIQVCKTQDLNDYIIIPSSFMSTSQITGSLFCKKGRHEVDINIYNKNFLQINFKKLKRIFNVYLDRAKLENNSSNIEIEAEAKNLDINIRLSKMVASRTRRGWLGRTFGSNYTYTYFQDKYSELELDIDSEKFDFDESKLRCKTNKTFSLFKD